MEPVNIIPRPLVPQKVPACMVLILALNYQFWVLHLIKIILKIALSGDPEESLQPRLQDTVGDCYNEPSHWLQGTLPLPHLRPASVD